MQATRVTRRAIQRPSKPQASSGRLATTPSTSSPAPQTTVHSCDNSAVFDSERQSDPEESACNLQQSQQMLVQVSPRDMVASTELVNLDVDEITVTSSGDASDTNCVNLTNQKLRGSKEDSSTFITTTTSSFNGTDSDIVDINGTTSDCQGDPSFGLSNVSGMNAATWHINDESDGLQTCGGLDGINGGKRRALAMEESAALCQGAPLGVPGLHQLGPSGNMLMNGLSSLGCVTKPPHALMAQGPHPGAAMSFHHLRNGTCGGPGSVLSQLAPGGGYPGSFEYAPKRGFSVMAGTHLGRKNGPFGERLGEHSGPPPSEASKENLPVYPNAAATPARIPAHRPVRLTQPKHPLAPPGTPVYFKYGEEHYPEESIPTEYTFTETDGTACRYITNFLVYNKRGERLLPIEILDQPRHGSLVLYGSLYSANSITNMAKNDEGKCDGDAGSFVSRGRGERRTRGSKKRKAGGPGGDGNTPADEAVPYPVRVELAEWCIDYGQVPQNVPYLWLISRWDVYYRLEKPAGRYIPTFASAKLKFELATRVIKTLQADPGVEYRDLIRKLCAATRRDQRRRRRASRRRREVTHSGSGNPSRGRIADQEGTPSADGSGRSGRVGSSGDAEAAGSGVGQSTGASTRPSGDRELFCDLRRGGNAASSGRRDTRRLGFDEDDLNGMDLDLGSSEIDERDSGCGGRRGRVGASRVSLKHLNSLSTAEGTGVALELANGQAGPRTPWGAPYAVEGLRESVVLGLLEFLETQARNFMEGMGARDDGGGFVNLFETRFMQTLREKAAIRRETIQLVEAKKRALESMATATGLASLPMFERGLATPTVALQTFQCVPVRQALPPGTQVAVGAPLNSPTVTVGYGLGGEFESFHNPHTLFLLRTKQQEEHELSQLLNLLKEFSDPESGNNWSPLRERHFGSSSGSDESD